MTYQDINKLVDQQELDEERDNRAFGNDNFELTTEEEKYEW